MLHLWRLLRRLHWLLWLCCLLHWRLGDRLLLVLLQIRIRGVLFLCLLRRLAGLLVVVRGIWVCARRS